MKAALLALLLAGCVTTDMTAEQSAACKLEKCHTLTTAQLKAVILHYTGEALKPVYEAGIEHGGKTCKRT